MRLLEVTAVTTLIYTYYFGDERSSSEAVRPVSLFNGHISY
jgi:hypothetical protein